MLNCHLVKSPDQKKEVSRRFTGERLWVVSDLESRYEIKKSLHGASPPSVLSVTDSHQVLRASELWKRHLLETDPDWHILPTHFASFFIEKWMEGDVRAKDFGLSPGDARRVYKTLGQILSLLVHCYGTDSMDYWFKENPQARQRWYHWYRLGLRIWEKFREKKIIPEEWTKALLLNNETRGLCPRPMVFDLDLAMDNLEAELILNLSRWQDVDVIVPGLILNSEADSPYYDLLSRCQPQSYPRETRQPQRYFLKYPSMLSEVKEAVARVRKWLDEGILTHEIGIVSPVIENYWPTLSEFLEIEGIPVNKTLVTPLSQMEWVQVWLSKMRLALGKMNRFDGQQIVYGKQKEPEPEYRKFQRKFENIYDVSDFNRLHEAKKQIPESLDPHQQVLFVDFIQWSVSLLSTGEQEELSCLLPDFDGIRQVTEVLSFEKWLQVFENYFARTEKIILPAQPHGIFVLSTPASMSPALEKILVLGLSENNLTESYNTALSWADVESIKTGFGFNLPHTDDRKRVEQLQWFQHKQAHEIIFSHSETDFSGQFQAPGFFWLSGAIQNNSLNLVSPSKTRWDEIMEYDPGLGTKTESFGKCDVTALERGMKKDKGLWSEDPWTFPLSLSASSFEEYLKCPFRFFAKNKLHLERKPGLDIEIDPMTRGSLVHSLCERVVAGQNFSLNADEVDTLVEQTRKTMDMEVYNEDIWSFLKPFYVQLIQRFMESERNWRKQYPLTQTYALEKEIKTGMKITDEGFCFSNEGDIPFRGFIDRIDSNGRDQFAVIDYKTSGTDLVQSGSWLKKGHLQLVLYSLAIIDGVLDQEPKNVVAAFYFVMKTMDRGKGFFSEEASSDFLPSKKNSRDKMESLFSDTRKLIGKILTDMKQGKFQPKPRDFKTCETCDWNKICRAPHLNH